MSRSRWLAVPFGALALATLAVLAIVSIRIGGDAVKKRARAELRTSTDIAALYIGEQLRGLTEVDDSFAHRPYLLRALRDPRHLDRASVHATLQQLFQIRPGIGTAFVASPDGRLIDIVPPTPSIVGQDFSYRDWYRGVTRTQRAYVSEAYRSSATGNPLVVAAASLVRDPLAGPSPVRGILVVAYRISTIQSFAERFSRTRGVSLRVTDQRGTILADPRRPFNGLVSARADARVANALAGRSGIAQNSHVVSAYAPIPRLGWTVTAELPTKVAFADVTRLRRAVVGISLLLGLVLCLVAALFGRTLRRSERERAAAYDRMLEYATLNQAVLDATADSLLVVDRDGHVAATNARAREIAEELGMSLAGSYTDIVPEERRDADLELIGDARRVVRDEIELPESGRVFARYTAPVLSADGTPMGRIFSYREVTAEREVERMKTELVATVSHELRTPLASILGFAELLVERDYDAETRLRFLETIRSEASRLTALVNEFLDVQRIEAGLFTLDLQPFRLDDLLRESVTVFSAQSSEHQLQLALPDESLTVIGERDRIMQVLGNLLSNAIKYSPAGGHVSVSTELAGRRVRVSVTDAGLGIPTAQQAQIFSKFFRVDSSETSEIGGTGLGLALTKEIVERHGGRIGFDSHEGEGSTFWFELPLAQTRAQGSGPLVLVVEDDPAAAELVAAELELGDYTVEVTATGEDALERVRRNRPAVVCLDITLAGDLDGWDVLGALKADPETASIPILVCTAGNGRDDAVTLGASDFLTKPFSAKRLRDALVRLLPPTDGNVLAVDDDPAVRALISEALAEIGVEVREAADGEEALVKIAVRRPDAIVLDLVMPRVDGFEVLERLQADASTRSIPVIVLTARQLSREERNQLSSRAVALLLKSAYSGDELRRLVREAVGR